MVQLKIRWISNYRCHRLVLYAPDHVASKLQCVCVRVELYSDCLPALVETILQHYSVVVGW